MNTMMKMMLPIAFMAIAIAALSCKAPTEDSQTRAVVEQALFKVRINETTGLSIDVTGTADYRLKSFGPGAIAAAVTGTITPQTTFVALGQALSYQFTSIKVSPASGAADLPCKIKPFARPATAVDMVCSIEDNAQNLAAYQKACTDISPEGTGTTCWCGTGRFEFQPTTGSIVLSGSTNVLNLEQFKVECKKTLTAARQTDFSTQCKANGGVLDSVGTSCTCAADAFTFDTATYKVRLGTTDVPNFATACADRSGPPQQLAIMKAFCGSRITSSGDGCHCYDPTSADPLWFSDYASGEKFKASCGSADTTKKVELGIDPRQICTGAGGTPEATQCRCATLTFTYEKISSESDGFTAECINAIKAASEAAPGQEP